MISFSLLNSCIYSGILVSDVESAIGTYYAALKEAGFDDVVAEFVSQWDAWK